VTAAQSSPRARGRLEPPQPLLAVEALTRRFGPGCPACRLRDPGEGGASCPACGTVTALDGVSFEVGPRETVGVVGESGSGKTTLLRCLRGELAASAGRATLEGVGELAGESPHLAPTEAVAMVHQDALAGGLRPQLAAETNVAERLLGGGRRDFQGISARAAELLERMDVDRSRHGDQLGTFSGGMRQRTQLARALVHPPLLLLLDEPTTGLDPTIQATVLALIADIVEGLEGATLVVSHDLGVVRLLADRVVVVRAGRVVEEGPTDQVLADPRHPYTRLLVASRLP